MMEKCTNRNSILSHQKNAKSMHNPNAINGEKAFKSAFISCDALKEGGIKVPSGQLAAYTEDDAIKTMFGDTCDVEKEKKKFAEYTP